MEAGRTELLSEPSRTSRSGRCLQTPSVMSLLVRGIIVTHTYQVAQVYKGLLTEEYIL